jgi:hypothetical protein
VVSRDFSASSNCVSFVSETIIAFVGLVDELRALATHALHAVVTGLSISESGDAVIVIKGFWITDVLAELSSFVAAN